VSTASVGADLYSMLGVPPSATTEEIEAAFREHAKALHPDLHPGDVQVAEHFKELTHAYDVLTRPERRDAYDRRSSPPPVAPAPERLSVFHTPARARAAVFIGIALLLLGLAGGVVLAGLDTGDAAKTITLWLVVVKLVVCGGLLWGIGAWRLRRLRARST
jgi:hypothetical protein